MCDPQTAWLLERGMKTLAVRWERQCANALALARRLEAHPRIERVHYPGLPSHPHHERATRQMNSFGAVLAFDVARVRGARRVRPACVDRARTEPGRGGERPSTPRPSHRGLRRGAPRGGIGDGPAPGRCGDEADLWTICSSAES
jgi:hypothetical protein